MVAVLVLLGGSAQTPLQQALGGLDAGEALDRCSGLPPDPGEAVTFEAWMERPRLDEARVTDGLLAFPKGAEATVPVEVSCEVLADGVVRACSPPIGSIPEATRQELVARLHATRVEPARACGRARAVRVLLHLELEVHTRPGFDRGKLVQGAYTREAQDRGVQGILLVKCRVLATGEVRGCQVQQPLPPLDAVMVPRLESLRVRPATFRGRPADVDYVFAFNFRLPR